MRFPILLALAALILPTAAAALPAPVPVVAAGNLFASPLLVVPAGALVEWVGGALPHTVTTSADLGSALAGVPDDRRNADGDPDTFHADLPMGATVRHAFAAPGSYAYYCELHVRLGMVGVVEVV